MNFESAIEIHRRLPQREVDRCTIAECAWDVGLTVRECVIRRIEIANRGVDLADLPWIWCADDARSPWAVY